MRTLLVFLKEMFGTALTKGALILLRDAANVFTWIHHGGTFETLILFSASLLIKTLSYYS